MNNDFSTDVTKFIKLRIHTEVPQIIFITNITIIFTIITSNITWRHGWVFSAPTLYFVNFRGFVWLRRNVYDGTLNVNLLK